MGIGSRIKTLLEEKEMSPKELADRIGISPTTVYSMIARDSKKADVDVLISMAKELGTTTDYILGTPDAEKTPTRQMLIERINGMSDAAAKRFLSYLEYVERENE